MTEREYSRYAKKAEPKSPVLKNVLRAFAVGGLICCAGQALKGAYLSLGLAETEAGTAVSVTLIFVAALLTGIGVFDDIARFAGAGTLVPITGFANAVAAPALEFKSEGFITGTAVKMFIVAGPVIVYGITASVIYGAVLMAFALR